MNRNIFIGGVMLLLLIVLSLWQLGFFVSQKTETRCRYSGIEEGSFSSIKPFAESMSMTPDGLVTFSMMNGAGNRPANITDMGVIYLSEGCQKEAICQIQNFQGKIKMEAGEVLEITAHCPDVHQEAGTKVYVYIRMTYEAVDVTNLKYKHTEDKIFFVPVK